MAIPVQKFRELVFQILYSSDIGGSTPEDILELMMKELAVTRKTVHQAQERVDEIKALRKELDKIIKKTSVSYDFDRIQTVEKNILRLEIYEMLYDDSIPPKVAISEGMRLARKFGSPESANFINAILDHIYKESQGEKPDAKQLAETAKNLEKLEEIAKEAAENSKKSEDQDEEE